MKVKISRTVEVSDEHRIQIADILDGKTTRRQATREEIQEFIWQHGADWSVSLFGGSDEEEEIDLDDLIGDVESDELEDLL